MSRVPPPHLFHVWTDRRVAWGRGFRGRFGRMNTHVRLYGRRSRRPNDSCNDDKQPLLCRRTADRSRTVPASASRSCTSRTGRSVPSERTSVRQVFPDIPSCILGTGPL